MRYGEGNFLTYLSLGVYAITVAPNDPSLLMRKFHGVTGLASIYPVPPREKRPCSVAHVVDTGLAVKCGVTRPIH